VQYQSLHRLPVRLCRPSVLACQPFLCNDSDRERLSPCTKPYSIVCWKISKREWDLVVNVNLKGVWLCMKHEIIQMLKQGSGAIVNTASVAGLAAIEGTAAYVASKHGVAGLTKTAALEYAKAGIRVNAVCPGYINTPYVERAIMANPQYRDDVTSRHPIGRVGRPEEIAAAVVWLCSDAAAFVTGHVMPVDGGYMAQ
ncbi:hypothetical protein C2W62_45240, partial [Candidatus Entotheonella serta]